MAEHQPEHGHPRSEDDRISSGKIVAVGVGALVVFFIASWITAAYLFATVNERPVPPMPAEIGQSKIGMVEQDPFALAFRGERDRAARLEHLDGYGWIDRERGIVHLPIGRAMDLYLKGRRATGPEPGAAPPKGGQP
jgi:hypothetical protein